MPVKASQIAEDERGVGRESPQPSDEALVASLADGDMSGLGELYMRHGRSVMRCLLHNLGDVTAAEDLCQEVFLALPSAAARYRESGKLRSWLFGIAIRKARDWRRKQWVRARLLDGFRTLIQVRDPEPELHVESEPKAAIERAFARLSPRSREVLVLQVSEQLTGAEIAEALAISQGAVRVRLHRARKELTEVFKQSERSEESDT